MTQSKKDVESHLLEPEDHYNYDDSDYEDAVGEAAEYYRQEIQNGPSNGNVRLNHSTAALAATIVGAGIVALPRAFAALGLIPGMAIFMVIFGLAMFSLSALIRAATSAECWTYDELANSQFGKVGARSLDFAIIANNSGSMIIYLIIMGDVLVGAPPHYSGIITNLFGIHSGDVWWVSRPFVMAIVCVAFLGPLVSLRNLKMLGPMSTVAVIVACLVSSVALLAGAAGFEGKLGDFNWLPNKALLGDTVSEIVITLLSILPVITMSFVCHYNYFQWPIIWSEANILLNLRPEAVEEYISPVAASLLCFAIRLAYCVCLMSTFAMLNWALRETLTNLIFGVRMLQGNGFLWKSYAIVFVEYLVSILFPNVWKAMSLTGATAAVYVSYILPGALILSVHGSGMKDNILGGVCVVLGVIMSVVGVVKTLFLS
eukprot:jgi/Picre1/31384/NNA_006736.t1